MHTILLSKILQLNYLHVHILYRRILLASTYNQYSTIQCNTTSCVYPGAGKSLAITTCKLKEVPQSQAPPALCIIYYAVLLLISL